MTQLHSTLEDSRTRFSPTEVQEMFGLKKSQYYNRLKFLEIEANKDAEGNCYLDAEQVDLLEALDEHINKTGKMDGFVSSSNGSLVTPSS